MKHGAIVYLDEIVEARKDTTVIIHPLSDDRRVLPIEKKGQIIEAVDDFMLVISYNPGYQSILKDLKQSTKQRFMAIEFDYPLPDIESRVVAHEAGVSAEIAPAAGQGCGKGPEPQESRPGRRRQHQVADLCGDIDQAGGGDRSGL